MHSSGQSLFIRAFEMTPAVGNTDSLQLKRFVTTVSVKANRRRRKTLEETRIVTSAVYGFSSGFLERADDVPIVKFEIFEKFLLRHS